MTDGSMDYHVWQDINYLPTIEKFLPTTLLSYLYPSQHILDLGCNKGLASIWLSENGYRVTGLDINPKAIETAKKLALANEKQLSAEFYCSDFLRSKLSPQVFDCVTMIRLLTCIPNFDNWEAMLDKVYNLIALNGLIYIHDFLVDVEASSYRERYDEYSLKNQRYGNFTVKDKKGKLQFIAHHHTNSEVEVIKQLYAPLLYREHRSFSMNGNSCLMFQFIGRKK